MLIDRTTIYVRSGKGGMGCVSFRREKYIPKGGPDGGDGGKGGDVILVGDPHLNSLLKLSYMPHKRAKSGEHGKGSQCHGSDGADLVVPTPLGTLVYNKDSDELIVDISEPGQRCIVAQGGTGGWGNEHFKSSTNQTPREATPGGEWEERTLRLELKLIADIGLIGLPNAGKSTMLRAISRANPRVADYPFTTLSPHLGLAELAGERRLVVADIPGLIEGAAEGAGLGHEFLRHVERTKVLVHILDIQPIDESDPVANFETIRREVHEYSPVLAEKNVIVVLNKIDLVPEEERGDLIEKIAGRLGMEKGERPLVTSGASGEGAMELMEACWELVHPKEQPGGWGGATPSTTKGQVHKEKDYSG